MKDEEHFEKIVNECKRSSIEIKNIDITNLPNSKGIIAIFKGDMDILFEENDIKKRGIDIFTLENYQSSNPIDLLFINPVNDIRKHFESFLNVSTNIKTNSGIIFSKIKNNQSLKFGFIIGEEKIKNSLLMNFIVKKFEARPIMNSRFGSNDAIPSWNGFNFQGFVTILRTLQLMNLKPKVSYDNFAVELERYEDFIIYECDKATELFQVKAYVAEKNANNYVEAFEKLLIHRKQINAPDATCYIATAEKIIDWDHSEYKGIIERYGYKDKNYIVMKDIIDNIFEELRTYYKDTDEDEKDLNLLMLAFSGLGKFFSKKIIQLHLKGNPLDKEYRISFRTIADLLDDVSKNSTEAHSYYTKVKIDQEVFKMLDTEIFDYCDNCDIETCIECPINNFREVFESVDRKKYAQVLTAKIFSDKNEIYKATTFNPNDLFDLFEDFYHASLDSLFYDNQHIYIANNTTNEIYMEKIIPTTIRINDPRNTGKGSTKLLKEIENRVELHPIFNKSSLTTTMKEKFLNFKDQQVTFIKDELLNDNLQDSSNQSISVDFDFNLINREFYREDMSRDE